MIVDIIFEHLLMYLLFMYSLCIEIYLKPLDVWKTFEMNTNLNIPPYHNLMDPQDEDIQSLMLKKVEHRLIT